VFYNEQPDKSLRFGDVISGFVSSVPKMNEPAIDHKHVEYQLELSMPEFCFVLSPCCSIGDSTITLAPLQHVINSFFKNPYFAEDLTRINQLVPPELSVSTEDWGRFSEEEKQKRLKEGYAYVSVEYFVYAEHEILPKYKVKLRGNEIETGCYMIDFRKSFRVSCPKVRSAMEYPVEAKFLQLTIEARQELRNKVSKYFLRLPQEDAALLQAA